MAKKSAIEKNNKRARMAKAFAAKRARLKALTKDESASPEDRFNAHMKLAQLPRNSSPTRFRLRCELTGRPRGVLSDHECREHNVGGEILCQVF